MMALGSGATEVIRVSRGQVSWCVGFLIKSNVLTHPRKGVWICALVHWIHFMTEL